MNPILQFGTSRFLQAHADLFISEAQENGDALGAVTIVQTTDSAQSARRVAAFNQPGGFPVRIRGRRNGVALDREQRVTSVTRALQASRDWPQIREEVCTCVKVIVSNTGDTGFLLSDADRPGLLESDIAPASFPAKLLVLLHARFKRNAAPVTLLPCELLVNNGTVLSELVVKLARDWSLSEEFVAYLKTDCFWVNSLVDRIVSEPLEPVGAVAEPYALWAIERQPNMLLPCRHPDMVVTDKLEPYERRKLFFLNLGHTFLAEQWQIAGGPADMTVLDAMTDHSLSSQLMALWEEEVMPIFRALGEEDESRAYLEQVIDRFSNPFLLHRLSDIAQNHAEKKRRRFGPVLALAAGQGLTIPQTRLRAALARTAS